MHLINRRRGARSSWPAPGAEPGNQDDLVFTVGPSRDVTDWFYTFQVCARTYLRCVDTRAHVDTRCSGMKKREEEEEEKEEKREKEGRKERKGAR